MLITLTSPVPEFLLQLRGNIFPAKFTKTPADVCHSNSSAKKKKNVFQIFFPPLPGGTKRLTKA